MLKYFLFLTRRPDVSLADFSDFVGQTYVLRLIANQAVGKIDRWNILLPQATVKVAHIADVPPPPPYDGFIEGWIRDESDLAQLGRELLAAGVGGVSDMIDEQRSCAVICEEWRTLQHDLGAGADAPDDGSMLKQVVNIRKKHGMSRDDFIAHYEGNHAPLAARILRMWSAYQRNFVRDDLTRTLNFGPVDEMLARLDVVTVIRYRNHDDQQAMNSAFADPVLGKTFADDEENLFDRSTIQMFLVQEHKVD